MKHVTRWGGRLLLFVIIAWGVLALAARIATPLLEYAHDPLANWLAERIGQPVQFGRMHASWWGVGPRLKLEDVRIGSGDDSVALQSVSIDLSHLSLLRGRLLDALRLTLDGMQLTLVREADRRIHLAGLPSFARREATQAPGSAGDGNSGLPLPRHLRLRHTRLRWLDHVRAADAVVIDDIDLDLVRRDRDLELRARLKSELGNARFSARITGFLGQDNWDGSSYLQVEGLPLRRLLSAYLPDRYEILAGRLRGEIWQEWRQATEVSTRGRFALRDLDLRLEAAEPRRFQARTIAGEIDYRRRSEGEWRLLLNELRLDAGRELPEQVAVLAIHRQRSASGRQFEVGANGLPVRMLSDLAAVLPLDAPLGTALQGLQPDGTVRDLRLSLSMGKQPAWAVNAKVRDLSVQPWRSIPAIEGLDLRLYGSSEQARLQLEGKDLRIDAQPLFRAPHTVNRLSGHLDWQPRADGWLLFSDDLVLSTPKLQSSAWFEYHHSGTEAGSLQLQARIESIDVAAVHDYLPAGVMSPKLVQWLQRSLSSGQLQQTDVLISGPLQDFPFHRTYNGSFEIVGLTRDTPLQYNPDWPTLSDLSARLFFHGNSLDIDLLEGRIFDSRFVYARAHIDSLAPTSPLRIDGRLRGPLQDQLQVLRQPALVKDFGHIARQLSATGDALLDLKLQIPLKRGHAPYQLDGTLRFLKNRLALAGWDLQLEQVQGDLKIGLDAIRASGLTGTAFGAPVSVDVIPNDASTRIHARTEWPVSTLQQRFPRLPLQAAAGSAEFELDIAIPRARTSPGKPVQIAVSSDLEGIRLDLPEPLGKTAGEQRSLKVDVPVGNRTGPIRVRYHAGRLDAVVSGDGERAEIRFDRGRSELPGEPGLRVLAKLPQVDLAQWRRLSARLPKGDKPLPWRLELATPSLSLDALTFADMRVDASASKGNVNARLEGPQLAGDIRYRGGTQPILTAAIERLHLSLPPREATPGPLPDPGSGPDPRALPRIDLQCSRLRLNDADLGELVVSLQPIVSGSRIKKVSLDGPAGRLQAEGHWQWKNARAHTHLNGGLQSPDLGELLHAFGQPRHIQGAESSIEFDLDWPGNPAQLHRATLNGSVDLEISEGRLSEIEPGVTRVLGLLSLDALKRRLKFDFGDLLKQGYSFDRIDGQFELDKGQANTRDLVVDGPSGKIELGGRIGLAERDFDQVVQVAPKLDATLIIASTIAGGPLAGAATFLAQRLLSEEVDRINRFEYAVTGTWDNPQLTPLQSGGPLSQLVHGLSGRRAEAKTQVQEDAIDETRTRPKKNLLEKLLGKRGERKSGDSATESAFPGGE